MATKLEERQSTMRDGVQAEAVPPSHPPVRPAEPSRSAPGRKKAKRNRTVPTLIGAIVVGAAGWFGWQKTHPAVDPMARMITATVTRGDLTETVTATGSITAQTGAMVKIGSQVTGRIKRLTADVGSEVKANQVIAELDLPDVQAQYDQAVANLAAARTKLAQQQTGVGAVQAQTATAVTQANANIQGAQAKLQQAQSAVTQQITQTKTDIQRAQTTLAVVKAALQTAQANLTQTQAGAALQVATAKRQYDQAVATADNADATLKRSQSLVAKGFVAQSAVDLDETNARVTRATVSSAENNVQLVQQKVTADLATAKSQLTQAQQNIAAENAALVAARAEINTNAVKQADVVNAQAVIGQNQAALKAALANRSQDTVKQQDIIQAREAVKAAEAQVAQEKAQVDKTFIRSPISGTVLQLAAQQGETLAAGLSAPTLIIVADLKRLQVDAFVDETDIGKTKIGQSAQVVVDAFPGRTFKGHITKVASGSTIQQGVVTYDVSIAIDDPQHELKPDMTANVTIATGSRQNVVLVPSVAVQVGVRGSTVNVVTGDKADRKVKSVPVTTGGTDGVNTEVVSGLEEGQTIVLAGAPARGSGGGNRPAGASSPFGGTQQRGGAGGGGGRRGG